MVKKEKIKYIGAIIFSCLSIFSIYYLNYLDNLEKKILETEKTDFVSSPLIKENEVISKEENVAKVAYKDSLVHKSSLIGVIFDVDGKIYNTKIDQGSSVLNLMNKIKKENSDFDFSGREYPGLGFFVDSINNKSNTNFSYWIYYVNEIQAEVGVSAYVLKEGDIISWRLE